MLSLQNTETFIQHENVNTYKGSIWGGWNFSHQPQSPPRNLEIEYGYYCGAINISYLILHVTGHKYVSSKCCLESLSQIVSEAI